MQPHSMCAVTLAKIIWQPSSAKFTRRPKFCQMSVEYRKNGEYTKNYYNLNNIEIDEDMKKMSVRVVRSNGGIDCTITARRSSIDEGSEITMEHSMQHIANLREEFKLWEKEIRDGRHYNSRAYRNYDGEVTHPDGETLEMRCECRVKNTDEFRDVSYTLKLESIE